jgi:hypothetical protein
MGLSSVNMTTTSNRREGFGLMPKRIAPETVAQIRALRARGYEVSEIVERVPASEMTVRAISAWGSRPRHR